MAAFRGGCTSTRSSAGVTSPRSSRSSTPRAVGRGSLRRVGEEHHRSACRRARFLPCTASRCAHEHDEPARSFSAVDRVGERRLGVVREGSHASTVVSVSRGSRASTESTNPATSRVSPTGRTAMVPIPDSVRPVRRSFMRFATIRRDRSAIRGVRSSRARRPGATDGPARYRGPQRPLPSGARR